MVSLRLSPEEYRRFEEIREARHMRSISHLARTAVQNMLATHDGEDPLSYELHDLRKQVRSLSLEVEKLAGLIEARKNNGAVSGQ